MTVFPHDMRPRRLRLWPLLLAALVIAQLVAVSQGLAARPGDQVEPTAGEWKTWVLSSGGELRLPSPPDSRATQEELRQLRDLAAQRPGAAEEIARWTSAGPIYPWNELALELAVKNGLTIPLGSRAMTLVNVAIYDATVAAWDSKYAHNRPRPSVARPSLGAAAPVPNSPSYPSEHAVAAAAAAEVLKYLFAKPEDVARVEAMVAEAGQTVLLAGLNYPSDVQAGTELGRAVAARVIERARADGSDIQWKGTVPEGPDKWVGTNPVLPLGGTWKTWALSSGSEFRPGPPPAHDSPQIGVEFQELRVLQAERTPAKNNSALFWEYGAGGARLYVYWNEILQRKVLEYSLANNPPGAARAFLLPNMSLYEAFVACWDAKYTYWFIRPNQLDQSVTPLFAAPSHPSYPSAHSCFSQSVSVAMAHLFPRDEGRFYALAEQASESRVYAGIHFRSDVQVGRDLGWAVGQRVIERAQTDSAQ